MDSEQCAAGQELVKVVLVGDNGVGKTRLVCARAYLQSVPLSQLLKTHVPTIWAIDQYRIYKEVLDKSWVNIDGVDVTLRLWDTFGDHHKDRRFAYERSDVILMCFDTGRMETLENCKTLWRQQIKQFCPDTPVMLVGCKNDLRYMHADPEYIQYCKERRPFVRQVVEKDLVLPREGRWLAEELGVPYYETSVLTFFGVTQLFENAARAALCARRTRRFWKTNLKNVLKPLIQEPFCPPKPPLPKEQVIGSKLSSDLLTLYEDSRMTDLIFICNGSVGFAAHKFVVSSVCPLLHSLLTMDLSSSIQPLSTNFGSTTVQHPTNRDENVENLSTPHHTLNSYLTPGELLKEHEKSLYRQSFAQKSLRCKRVQEEILLGPGVFRQLNHPAFQSIHIQQCIAQDDDENVISSVQTILTCSKLIDPKSLQQVLRFLYTGTVDFSAVDLHKLKQTAEFLEVRNLFEFLSTARLPSSVESIVPAEDIGRALGQACLESELFSDVLFRLDDGVQAAHKAILMARCDVMAAMFSDNFLEGSADVVNFPDTTRFAFKSVQYFLYTDEAPLVSCDSSVKVLELANRLVLPRLISLVEQKVIEAMNAVIDKGGNVFQDALEILQPCQIHNAEQLAQWCFSYLGQNYNDVSKRFPKMLKRLCPENQALLNLNRWPPMWYLRDFDLYERLSLSCQSEKGLQTSRKKQRINSACLCFSAPSQPQSSYNLAALTMMPPDQFATEHCTN